MFDLLLYLVRNRERVVSRNELFDSIWAGRVVSESTLDTRINAARSAVGDSGVSQRLIKTFPRKGVRFVGLVREEPVGAASSRTDTASLAPVLPDRPSIAVLPFANLSDDPEQGYFADGIAEEIITALSRCSWLFVIARNSSFTYKGRSVDVRQIGRELGIRYVLEGSVRRAGDRLRIMGQLSEASSGANIWADRFDGDRRAVFDLQDRITESVVAAVEPSVQRAEIERTRQKSSANIEAYDLLLRAQQLEYEFTAESLSAAMQIVDQALAIDTSYATAMALGAYCRAERRFQGWAQDPKAEEAEGLRLASQAVELARNDANVLWMAAYAVRELGMSPNRSMELVNRSLQLNPNSAIALTIAAWNEVVLANPDKALELLARAERLSPRDPRAWFMATAAALAYLSEGRFDDAVAKATTALAQNRRSAQALRILAVSLAKVGDREGAAEAIQEVLKIEPQLTASRLRARLPFMPETLWNCMAEGLHIAGLPD